MTLEKDRKNLSKRFERLEQKYERKPQNPGTEEEYPLIIEEDFENWNDNGWTIFGTPLIEEGVGRNGSYGMYIDCNGEDDRNFIYKSMTARSNLDVTFYVRFQFITGCTTRKYDLLYVDCSGVGIPQIIFEFEKTGGVFYLSYTGTLDYGNIQALSLGQWYKVRIELFRDSTNGYEKIWIDDVLKVDNSGNTDMGAGMDTYYFGMVEFPAAGDVIVFDMDDIEIRGV